MNKWEGEGRGEEGRERGTLPLWTEPKGSAQAEPKVRTETKRNLVLGSAKRLSRPTDSAKK